jgi:protein-S-isoprenylcysteine O-methyltransferase Ste14
MNVGRHLRALILPVTATIAVPGILLIRSGSLSIEWPTLEPVDLLPLIFAKISIGIGLLLVVRSIHHFWTTGHGTLAPWDPPRNLVIRGVYRYVRNPMISGILGILLGEALLFGSLSILAWFVIFLLINLIYISRYEEPGLVKRFGEDYLRYRDHVPRWIPRPTPWEIPRNRDLEPGRIEGD